jgi:hypothetical protein
MSMALLNSHWGAQQQVYFQEHHSGFIPLISQQNLPRQGWQNSPIEGRFLLLRGIQPFLECLKLQLRPA